MVCRDSVSHSRLPQAWTLTARVMLCDIALCLCSSVVCATWTLHRWEIFLLIHYVLLLAHGDIPESPWGLCSEREMLHFSTSLLTNQLMDFFFLQTISLACLAVKLYTTGLLNSGPKRKAITSKVRFGSSITIQSAFYFTGCIFRNIVSGVIWCLLRSAIGS